VIADHSATFGTNNLTVGRNGSTINGTAADLTLDISGVSVQFVYNGTTWDVFAQIGGNGGTAMTLNGTETATNKTFTTGNAFNGTLGATTPSTVAATTISSTTGANFATTSGNVGIGTTSPAYILDVGTSGTVGNIHTYGSISSGTLTGYSIRGIPRLTNDAGTFENTYVGCGATYGNIIFQQGNSFTTSSNTERMRIGSAGAIKFNAYGAGSLTTDGSGNITAVSDERIKRNIRPFSRGLSEIIAINTILHGYTEESGLDQLRDDYAGFSAQQVQPLIPEAIGVNSDGMLSFSDRPIIAALVNAVKELSARLAALESN
jgi:hypothetical protein